MEQKKRTAFFFFAGALPVGLSSSPSSDASRLALLEAAGREPPDLFTVDVSFGSDLGAAVEVEVAVTDLKSSFDWVPAFGLAGFLSILGL